jgi:hypothetical protein
MPILSLEDILEAIFLIPTFGWWELVAVNHKACPTLSPQRNSLLDGASTDSQAAEDTCPVLSNTVVQA